MNTHQPYRLSTRSWSSKLSLRWIRFWTRARKRQTGEQRLQAIRTQGLEHLEAALRANCGILITPNHSSHADHHALMDVALRISQPFHVMTAWQIFAGQGPLARLFLRHHGCFSVNREAADLKAFQAAAKLVAEDRAPLIIFPEGEIYHQNDNVTGFNEGAALIALRAAQRADRPVVCLPCAVKLHYVEDPTPELLELTARLEFATSRRPRPDLSLLDRVRRLLAGLQRQKERQYFGRLLRGSLHRRAERLSEFILSRCEEQCGIPSGFDPIPSRVGFARRRALELRQAAETSGGDVEPFDVIQRDLMLVIQLFSYPPGYLDGEPTIERIAETLDKLEEDVLLVPTATPRGTRIATVAFSEPIPVPRARKGRAIAVELTEQLESTVQTMLNELSESTVTSPQPQPQPQPEYQLVMSN